jgi:hypothetical protein
MKNFMILHFGFVRPTSEEMASWNRWFDSIADRQVDRGHFSGGRELSSEGMKELPMAEDSITGFTVIRATDLDEAETLARSCPIVASTRVYEVRGG